MITNPIAFEKDKLIRDIYTNQKQVAELLLLQDDQQKIAQLIYDWHSHKNFFIQNAGITKISLEELKEKHTQIIDLLERVKDL
ncbi:hypothetical protein COE15_21350 [Bacillus cereus]|uniref:hypothetical protein n=1 Tax=Bacillus sp. AFS023182 TaxID=2033492 RepID=UPI000BF507E5|nr:hypothetical protein [Bacillus sp. AFS023182]PFD97872.1 hypothetical protein CN288_21780 [Bacillus sp. AFS023182]PGX95056.1 hypothetical protein COE15_21350 [Bacillus cereus]